MALPRPTNFGGVVLGLATSSELPPYASEDEDTDSEQASGEEAEEVPVCQNEEATTPPPAPADARREAQWKLHKEGRFNDLRLVVDGRSFGVNSMVMATESSFFAALLGEGARPEIAVCGLPTDAAALLVEFAYRGRLEHLDAHADVLLGPAVRFGMGELKAACIRSLQRTLSLENAAERTILAVESDVEELRAVLADFFRRNPAFPLRFLVSTRMCRLIADEPQLAARVQRFVKETLAAHSSPTSLRLILLA
ncbi:Kelch-like protein diablo [Aphelenchoides fujianensis]|nr:Kelch-like protein diablo [Aphelenchoides fujianensis]